MENLVNALNEWSLFQNSYSRMKVYLLVKKFEKINFQKKLKRSGIAQWSFPVYCQRKKKQKKIVLRLRNTYHLACSYMFKVNYRNIRRRCEICLKLTLKTEERHHGCHYGVFIVNFKHILHLVLVFLLFILSR